MSSLDRFPIVAFPLVAWALVGIAAGLVWYQTGGATDVGITDGLGLWAQLAIAWGGLLCIATLALVLFRAFHKQLTIAGISCAVASLAFLYWWLPIAVQGLGHRYGWLGQ
jgi:hypothetical protein